MCYCDNSSDEDELGNCINSSSQNFTSKFLIVFFIVATLLLAIFAVVVKGQKYFLYKTIEDVQELSLIVFINMYFPQQFDIFLTHLYRFNISSYTFQNMA
jgi:cell division protein FtsL